MPRFYDPHIATTFTLSEEESRHCVRVLRLAEGDEIEVVDGLGNLYTCRIAQAHAKHCRVEIVDKRHEGSHWRQRIVLCVAPTKNLDRMEDMVDRVTEMGVDRIVPLLCHNSERKVFKTERVKKIMISAMKQSLKASLPRLDELTPFMQLVKAPFHGKRFIAYVDPLLPRSERMELAQEFEPGVDTMIVIGPEGDFSPGEIDVALQADFVPISLGQSRLRTETAAMYAVAVCHAVGQLKGKG